MVGSDLEMNTQKCTNCKQEEKDERISINEEREEKLLKDSIWLDPAENRFIARLPTTGNPNILLEDNKESTDNPIRNVLRRLKGNEEDISEVKGSFKKLLDKSFIVKLSDMDEEVRKDINKKGPVPGSAFQNRLNQDAWMVNGYEQSWQNSERS